jgi:dihydrofolate synthase/folylpolyglutamate synthase
LKFVFSEIAKIPHQNLHIVLGMVNDKDVENILTMFPPAAHYYFCKANIPRGMDAHELCLKAQSKNLRGEVFDSVAAAYTASQIQAQPQDLILVTGSFFTVAEVLAIKH